MTAIPKGFRFAGVASGIKSDKTKNDMALLYTSEPCAVAGVYTQNLVVAAPVVLDRQRTPGNSFRGVIVNSGNANACTGQQGFENAVEMAQIAAGAIGCDESEVLVMSTGIIGEPLPMDVIRNGAASLIGVSGDDESSLFAAADGILTTDNGRKTASRQIMVNGTPVNICGIAKGAGMIGINMATFLAVVMTDARIDAATLQMIQSNVIESTFNCVSVEGHTSTNDTFLLMANGASETGLDAAAMAQFEIALEEVCLELAKKIPADGEGATHLIEISVTGAPSDEDARRIAETVGNSNLVKTCIAGNDPNWGRIVSAVGYAGVDIDANDIVLHIFEEKLFENSEPIAFEEAALSAKMKSSTEVAIQIGVGHGEGSARIWTSDLTTEYVVFNADYHT